MLPNYVLDQTAWSKQPNRAHYTPQDEASEVFRSITRQPISLRSARGSSRTLSRFVHRIRGSAVVIVAAHDAALIHKERSLPGLTVLNRGSCGFEVIA